MAVPVLAGWVYGFVVLCPGTPEGSTGSCPGFKASQKTGQQLNVPSGQNKNFVAVFLGLGTLEYWLGGSVFFVVLCPGAPEGSTGSCSDFKASQKTGPQLIKSRPTDWEMPGARKLMYCIITYFHRYCFTNDMYSD